MASKRSRLDDHLVEVGLTPTRSRARALILAGKVLVDDSVMDKAGFALSPHSEVRLKEPDHPYVGRGGVKMAGALDAFGIEPKGLRCLDLGASTGGFTDCLLQRGALAVVAVDVGTNQLAWRLRSDPRVQVYEQTDARELGREQVEPPPDLVVMDLSFIGLSKIWSALLPLLPPGTPILALVKPQFEAGRERVEKGGVVRDPQHRESAIQSAISSAQAAGLLVEGREPSTLAGARKGNIEEFVLFRVP